MLTNLPSRDMWLLLHSDTSLLISNDMSGRSVVQGGWSSLGSWSSWAHHPVSLCRLSLCLSVCLSVCHTLMWNTVRSQRDRTSISETRVISRDCSAFRQFHGISNPNEELPYPKTPRTKQPKNCWRWPWLEVDWQGKLPDAAVIHYLCL